MLELSCENALTIVSDKNENIFEKCNTHTHTVEYMHCDACSATVWLNMLTFVHVSPHTIQKFNIISVYVFLFSFISYIRA